MSAHLTADRLWYVVLNRHEGRILKDLADFHDPAHAEAEMSGPDRTLRETRDDRPGRSFSSFGGGRRSAIEPGTDPLREDSRRFLRDLFAHLETHRDDFDGLVLIGAPDVVGLWRDLLPGPLAPLVRREIVKNLLPLPPESLVGSVRKLLEKAE